jgi:hypothetical protein
MMSSEAKDRITLLEARVTLLERRFRQQLQAPDEATKPSAGPISYSVDQPGLIICDAYEIERDEAGRPFCWVGGVEQVQLVIPYRAEGLRNCRVRLLPHPRVDFAGLRVVVNDEAQEHVLSRGSQDLMQLEFRVRDCRSPNLNVLLRNVRGIRPEETGENHDGRLLIARFYGVEFADV